ncbi:MAG: hypothetical protein ACM31O_03840 [Bacteroidota bacterium]
MSKWDQFFIESRQLDALRDIYAAHPARGKKVKVAKRRQPKPPADSKAGGNLGPARARLRPHCPVDSNVASGYRIDAARFALKHPDRPLAGNGRWRITVVSWNRDLRTWMTLPQKPFRGELADAILAAKRAAAERGGRGGVLRILA